MDRPFKICKILQIKVTLMYIYDTIMIFLFLFFQTLDSVSSHRSSPVLYDQAVVAAQTAAASTTASASTPGQGTRDMNFKTTSNNSQQAVIIDSTIFFQVLGPSHPSVTSVV